MLCEFTSAVTPSVVGGSGLTFIYLNREGVTMGRSLFAMFGLLLADEAFLAVSRDIQLIPTLYFLKTAKYQIVLREKWSWRII